MIRGIHYFSAEVKPKLMSSQGAALRKTFIKVRLKTFMQVRLKTFMQFQKTFMQVQKTFMQVRLKTFMQVRLKTCEPLKEFS